jgi:hypothetical protein
VSAAAVKEGLVSLPTIPGCQTEVPVPPQSGLPWFLHDPQWIAAKSAVLIL